jgi:hypothetical protein
MNSVAVSLSVLLWLGWLGTPIGEPAKVEVYYGVRFWVPAVDEQGLCMHIAAVDGMA